MTWLLFAQAVLMIIGTAACVAGMIYVVARVYANVLADVVADVIARAMRW